MPGTSVVQTGQRGAQGSLFIRGGASDANKVLFDGVTAGDLGGRFDFGPVSTAGMQSAEVYRGPDSSLYGAGAESGVVSFTTPRGTTSFPSLLFHGDYGNFTTFQDDLTLAGAHNKLDYLGAVQLVPDGQRSAERPVSRGDDAGEPGLPVQREDAGARDAALWCFGNRSSRAVGFLPGGERCNGEGPGPLHRRDDRQPDDAGLSQHGALRIDAQARAVQPVVAGRVGHLRRLRQ